MIRDKHIDVKITKMKQTLSSLYNYQCDGFRNAQKQKGIR